MRTIILLGAFLISMVFSALPSSVSAKSNYSVAIGSSIDSPTYSDSNFRSETGIYNGSEFLEWYVFDDIGIGVRTHKSFKSASEVDLLMVNLHFALTWFFMGNPNESGLAAYVGVGPGQAVYSDTGKTINVTGNTSNTSSIGLFLDWGRGAWGLRIGFNSITAKYGYLNGAVLEELNGSYKSLGFAVRYAF